MADRIIHHGIQTDLFVLRRCGWHNWQLDDARLELVEALGERGGRECMLWGSGGGRLLGWDLLVLWGHVEERHRD